jgi:Glyoxalase-like domain
MSHRSLITAIVIDVPSDRHADEVAFWSGAAGKDLPELSHPEYHGARLTPTLVLLVQELGDGAPRVHVDIHTDDVDAEVTRLTALGAHEVERVDNWVVMRDPAGLPFCVVAAPPGALDGADAVEWA